MIKFGEEGIYGGKIQRLGMIFEEKSEEYLIVIELEGWQIAALILDHMNMNEKKGILH